MAAAAVSSLVKLLGDPLINEVKFLRDVEGKVSSLKDELERMQAFLIYANKKQYEDERVRRWISEVRELAQDAEDTIEMFLINAQNARCITFFKCVRHLHTIGEEIDSIQAKLEAIKRSRDLFGIKDLEEAAASTQSLSRVEWRRRQIDDQPVGLEDDVEELLRGSILDEKKKGLSIAVVEGMGGIGKSTLARKIYNHPHVVKVGDPFECRAWVVVSSEFSPQETIKQIILELGGSNKQELRELEESTKDKHYLQQKLQEMLRKQLEGKTYFIVLDDVWEVEHWEFLNTAFPNDRDKNSRILITTRNKGMAKYGHYSHEMKGLNPEKSWELLLNKAFSDGKCPQADLESIGSQILEKCKGLPLAIKVVGGLLVGEQNKGKWEKVLHQINSHLDSFDSNVIAILELSYQKLSPQLKSCFICLAFFKEDANISSERLVHIWVGQGLIPHEEGRTMEEVGGDYLDELINRNMVQISELNIDDSVKTCQIHDLVREVCLQKAKEEIGFSIVYTTSTSTSTNSSSTKPRHCVVNGEKLGFYSLKDNKNLRSLFLVNTDLSCLKSFQLLKILDIECFGHMGKLPCSFRTLVGLKYLRIHTIFRSTVLKIPRWFDRLKKLEVIDFELGDVQFPNVKLKMERLRHFKADNVYGLVGLENWKNIETLRRISIDEWMRCSSKGMATCPLRELDIRLNAEEDIDLFCRLREMLEKMENLVTLQLRIPQFVSPIDAALCIPHVGSHLTKLTLRGPMKKCPDASKFPPNLSHLTLKWSNLNEDPMPELGKLPNLSYLELSYESYNGNKMKVLHDGFPCLEVLALIRMSELGGIEIEEGGMSQLKYLRIDDCPTLETQNLPEHIIITAK